MRTLKIWVVPDANLLPLPSYATDGASGIDLRASRFSGDSLYDHDLYLKPMQRHLVHTGLVVEMPAGFEGQVRPRSGLALKSGLTVLNSPGTIDLDYRGEIGVIMVNLGSETCRISRGDRIAQLVIAPVARMQIVVALPSEMAETARGVGGFGHTGTS